MIKQPLKYTEDNSAMIGQLANEIQNLKTNFNKAMHIGSGNKGTINLVMEGGGDTTLTGDTSLIILNAYTNAGAQDFYIQMNFPLPLSIYDLDGTAKNLIITSMNYYIIDSDAGDYCTAIYIRAYPEEANYDTLLTLDHDVVNGTGVDLFNWDFADQTIGGSYKRLYVIFSVIATDARDFDLAYADMEYYYG